jgi:hypothetical protein
MHLARGNGEVKPVEGANATESLLETACVDHDIRVMC